MGGLRSEGDERIGSIALSGSGGLGLRRVSGKSQWPVNQDRRAAAVSGRGGVGGGLYMWPVGAVSSSDRHRPPALADSRPRSCSHAYNYAHESADLICATAIPLTDPAVASRSDSAAAVAAAAAAAVASVCLSVCLRQWPGRIASPHSSVCRSCLLPLRSPSTYFRLHTRTHLSITIRHRQNSTDTPMTACMLLRWYFDPVSSRCVNGRERSLSEAHTSATARPRPRAVPWPGRS